MLRAMHAWARSCAYWHASCALDKFTAFTPKESDMGGEHVYGEPEARDVLPMWDQKCRRG